MQIKPLNLSRKHNGFALQLVRRHKRLALLLKTLPTYPTFKNWEVVVIQVGPVHPQDEVSMLEGWTHVERIPSSEQWGTYGWTFIDEQTAMRRFEEACADYDIKMREVPEVDSEPSFDTQEPEF